MPKIICKGSQNKGVGRDAITTGMQIGGKKMPRYIDAEMLKKVMDVLPSEDVVEVVRCKDCRFFVKDVPCVGGTYCGCGHLEGRDGSELAVYSHFFCAFGERRTDEEHT